MLQALERAHPDDANIHKALGEAFAALAITRKQRKNCAQLSKIPPTKKRNAT